MLPDHFPTPPPIVENAIYHWLMWLDNLPKVGPTVDDTCGSAEKAYAHIMKKLQAQYYEPQIKLTFDARLGERFDTHFRDLEPRRRLVVRMAHYQGLPVGVMRKRAQATEAELCTILRNAYDQLAAKLSCPKL